MTPPRRRNDRHLPPCVYLKHGAYWFVRARKWTRLGTTLPEALAAYAALHSAPQGGMAGLIADALPSICARLAPNTRAQYATAARKLSKMLAEFAPEQVKPTHIAQIKASMAATPNMANRCLSLLRQVFHYALELGLVESNPAIGIKRHLERKRDRLLSVDEVAAIYKHAGPRLQVIIDLCQRTGQRVGDVLAIRRADLTDEGISFRQAKTGARVLVPWSPELREVVDRAKALHGVVSALTLLRGRGGKPPNYSSVRDQWDRACLKAKVADAHLHDLRAMAATHARRQGLDATALLGHTTPGQTRRYLRDREPTVAPGPAFGVRQPTDN